jgi:hypothetical protein
MRSDSPDGPMTDLFGLDPAPADLLAPPASAKASTTRATFGRNGFGSSASAGLACCLVSNLRTRTRGSILFRLTRKATVTPSGRLIYRLRASEARTAANGLASWPTPTTPSGGQSVPPGTTATGRRPDGSKATVTLEMVARLAAWPTPMAGTPAQNGNNEAGNTDSSRRTVDLVTGSPAQMEPGGRLRAGHSRWLMRIPPVWDACASTADAIDVEAFTNLIGAYLDSAPQRAAA